MNKNSISHILIVCTLLLSACQSGNQEKQTEVKLRAIKYSKVLMNGGISSKAFNGVIQSSSETNLSFRSNGLIAKIKAKVGDKVTKGQLLAELDMKNASLNYEKAAATARSNKTQLETSKSNLNRIKSLYQGGSSSLLAYETAKNSYATAQANYQSAQKSLALQAEEFVNAKIISPMQGVVTEVKQEVNEYAMAGNTIIVINAGNGRMEVNVGVSETYITKIKAGQEVTVSVKETALTGIITEVGYSNSGSSTYPVIVRVKEESKDIRPGMPAVVSFKIDNSNQEKGLMVPITAVSNDAENNFVYQLIATEDEKVFTISKTVLELGPLSNDGFLVLSELKEGDLVATAGLRSLYAGMKVELLEKSK